MNSRNPALDCYVNAAQDVIALRAFTTRNVMTMTEWDERTSPETRRRMILQGFIKMTPIAVYLTAEGRAMFPPGTKPGGSPRSAV